jgi:hypothetical protein
MNEVVIEVQKSRRSRLFGGRIATLTAAATLLVSGAFALGFNIVNSPIEFGQGTGTIQTCAYQSGTTGFDVTPSSSVDGTGFEYLTSVGVTQDGYSPSTTTEAQCANKVISIAMEDGSGTPVELVDYYSVSLTTIEIFNAVDQSGSDYTARGDLVSNNDVLICSSDGLTCEVPSGDLTVTNSNQGGTILISGSIIDALAAPDIQGFALQTTDGFSNGTVGS